MSTQEIVIPADTEIIDGVFSWKANSPERGKTLRRGDHANKKNQQLLVMLIKVKRALKKIPSG